MQTGRAYLYRLDQSRKACLVGIVNVPGETLADIERNYRTNWLERNGYDPRRHFLRAKPIIETTDAERQAMLRYERALKASGKLPSALGAVAAKLVNAR